MFLPDKELRGAGGRRQNDRARVVERAKELREARTVQRDQDAAARRVQRFLRGQLAVKREHEATRCDFDAKVADIEHLLVLLQRSSMPLPFDVLLELLRKLLFCYRATRTDQRRLEQLCGFYLATLETVAAPLFEEQWASRATTRWQLQRLVDLCLQAHESTSTVPLVLARQLCDICPFLRAHVESPALHMFSRRSRLFSAMSSLSLGQLTRAVIAVARMPSSLTLSSRSTAEMKKSPGFAQQLVAFVIHVAQDSSTGLLGSFVEQVLTIPLVHDVVTIDALVLLTQTGSWARVIAATQASTLLLPPSPVVGIDSSTWLLGNLLWLAHRVPERADATMLEEVQMFTRLLQLVPPETYAPSGVAMSWTKVSGSHSIPVVYPDALNDQLRLLLQEKYLRQICTILLEFHPSALHRPLVTERPTPMHPMAPTVAEQFGFGDIATARSFHASLNETWHRVKMLGKSNWAKKLLVKAGLKMADRPNSSPQAAPALHDMSRQSRHLARGSEIVGRVRSASGIAMSAFNVDQVYAVCRFFTTFMYRWPSHSKHSQRHVVSMKMLNMLSFYQFSIDERDDYGNFSNVHIVHFLWAILQEVKDFDDYAKSVDLVHVKSTDGYAATLTIFCLTYTHLLVVLDDEEMYEQQLPLPLCQVERVVVGLKRALHAAYWVHGNVVATPEIVESLDYGKFVVDSATRLLSHLYGRCSRIPFCNVTSWIIPGLDSAQVIDEVLAGTPRANKLISSIPFIVPFAERVKLFQRLVQVDKQLHQGEGAMAQRVRIRRGALLEDGLSKLNVIRSSLKKKINVVFVNATGREEVGIDAGGLFKEFWLDLATLAFDLEYGLFLSTSEQLLYPNPEAASAHFARESDHLTLFQFLGRVLGKALYEGIVVQPKFAHFFLSKLLHSFNHLSELPSLDPEIYKNLMFLKVYEGNVEDLGLTHTIVREDFGAAREVELLPGGADVPVTNTNKTRYIHLVAHYYLNTQIREQSAAFRAGLADLIDLRWLQLFNEPELQVLISGKSGDIDVDDLRAHTKYAGGFYAMDKRVQWLWQALASFSPAERAAFLRFATSCQRAPSLGFSSHTPPFCVQKIPIRHDDELLPASSTCFNTLKLPTYASYKTLRAKLLLAISSGAGFEMT